MGLGERCELPQRGLGRINLIINYFNYFAENHLIKLSAVSLFTAAFAVVSSF